MSLTQKWLRENTQFYSNSSRTYADVDAVLPRYPSLRPKTDVYTYDDGRTQLLLCLHGLLSISYRQASYNIPIAVWLTRDYPKEPPISYVVATSDMLIRPSRHVDSSGRCNIDYIENWHRKSEGCNVLALLESMQSYFSKEPPVYAKPKDQPPPSSQPSLLNRDYSAKPPPPVPQIQSPSQSAPDRPPLPPKPNPSVPNSHVLLDGHRSSFVPTPPPTTSPPPASVQHHQRQQFVPPPPPVALTGFSPRRPPPPLPASPDIQPSQQWSTPSANYSSAYPQAPISPPPTQVYQSPPTQAYQLPYHSPPPTQFYQSPPQPPSAQFSPPLSSPPPLRNILDEDDTGESSLPPPVLAAAPPRPPNPELLRLHSQIHAKLSSEFASLSQAMSLDAERLRTHQRDLLTGEPAIRDEMSRLEAVRDVCIGVSGRLRAVVDQGERNVNDLKQKGDPEVDELVCSTTIVYNQLINLIAEDNAIEDTIYHLHRALNAGRIDLERFLRTTRVLAEEQFMKRALIEKIRVRVPMGNWS